MSFPTVAVTVTLRSEEGIPYEGVIVTAHLDRNDRYQGFVISCDARATTDSNGVAVLNLFPNHPTTGLGTTGSIYHFHASIPKGKNLNEYAQVPNTDCMLDAIASIKPAAGLSDAEAAAASAAASAAAASASAQEAAESAASVGTAADDAQEAADAAAASAAEAAQSASLAGGSAAQAANSAAAAFISEQNAFGSEQAAVAARDAAQLAASQAQASAGAADASADAAAASALAAAGSVAEAEAAADAAQDAASASYSNAIIASTAAELALDRANIAQDAADAAADSAHDASEAANNALAIYGSTTALSDAVSSAQGAAATATAQAGLAQGYAQQAASVVQQDLSGVIAAALHRSPNSVIDMRVYDVSRDSDGGVWVDRMEGKSWMTEALNGAWLDATHYGPYGIVNELQARNYRATVGAELIAAQADRDFSSDTGFWTKGTGWTINGAAAHSGGTPEYLVRNGLYPASGGVYKWEFDVLTADASNFLQVYDGAGAAYGSVISRPGHYIVYVPGNLGVTARIRGVGNCSFDNLSIKQVTGVSTPSGEFYQLATDGKFYRLWKNVFGNSAWLFADPAAPSGAWSRPSPTLGTTAAAGVDASGATRIRFSGAIADRPYIQNTGINVLAGEVWTVSFYVDEASQTFTMNQCVSWAGSAAAGAAVVYRNGTVVASPSTTNLTAGDFIEAVYTFTAGGTFSPRLGPGSSAGMNVAFNVVLSRPQLERASRATAFELKTTNDQTQSEVFRGNKAKFPRLVALVAEQSRMVLYDLTEPGRPMWKVILPVTNGSAAVVSSVAAGEGGVLVCGTGALTAFQFWDFAGDRIRYKSGSNTSLTFPGLTKSYSATGANLGYSDGGPGIVSATVNAGDLCVSPDAPVDPVSGLLVPMFALATASGVNVIRHDGAVFNSTQSVGFEAISIRPEIMLVADYSSSAFYFYRNPGKINATFGLDGISSGVGQPNFLSNAVIGVVTAKRSLQGVRCAPYLAQSMLNELSYGSSLAARTAANHTTGWLAGDVRRCLLSDVVAGVVNDANLCTNGTFDVDTAGWAPLGAFTSTAAAVGGEMRVTATASNGMQAFAFSSVIGKRYRVAARGRLVSGTGTIYIGFCSASGGDIANALSQSTLSTTFVSLVAEHTATETTTRVFGRSQTSGDVAAFDDFVITEVVADRSNKNKPSTVYGTLTKTAVASGAQLVMYSGFTSDPSWTAEYIGNGTFTSGTTGWYAGFGTTTSTFTAPGGVGTLTKAGGDLIPRYVTAVAGLTVGAQYVLTFTHTNASVDDRILHWSAAPAGDGNPWTTILMTESGKVLTATASTMYLALLIGQTQPDGATVTVDNVSIKRATAGATPAANFAQEPYSADLDFASGFNLPVWFSLPTPVPTGAAYFPDTSAELVSNPGGPFVNTTGWTMLGAGSLSVSGGALRITNDTGETSAYTSFPTVSGRYYRLKFNVSRNGNSRQVRVGTGPAGSQNLSKTIIVDGPDEVIFKATAATTFVTFNAALGTAGTFFDVLSCSTKEVGAAWAVDRSAATGPYWRFGCNPDGTLVGEAYDGTTTRTVATSVSYAGLTALAELSLGTQGSLTIRVNGEQMAQATGAPLATLANAAAVLTHGNSRNLNAAWPGGLALSRPGATVPSEDASRFMYAQEAAMFTAGAQVALPDSGTVLDMGYDLSRNVWRVITAANEVEISGLVRTASLPAAVGSLFRVAGRSSVRVVARITTNPGVDVTIPAQNLKDELLRREEFARRFGKAETLDYVGGFTANISNVANGTNQFAGVAGYTAPPLGATVMGAQFTSASGVAAGSAIAGMAVVGGVPTPNWSSLPFTAAVTGAAIAFLDFILPAGMVTVSVSVNGALKQEGATKDYTRLSDGFRERVRFAVAPGNTAWVQIQARRTP